MHELWLQRRAPLSSDWRRRSMHASRQRQPHLQQLEEEGSEVQPLVEEGAQLGQGASKLCGLGQTPAAHTIAALRHHDKHL